MMKHKVFALILALTVVSWAQISTQAPTQPPADKANCACCDKMASSDAKGSAMACKRMGKDGKGCMKDDKSASCCKDCKDSKDKTASCCGDKCKGDCCSKMKMEHAGMACCHHEKRS